MNRVQIDVPCALTTDDGRIAWRVMHGELLHDIAPHLAHVATFALNDNPVAFWAEYVVTNLETGMVAGRGGYPSQAIAAAKRNLARITAEHCRDAIERNRPEGE